MSSQVSRRTIARGAAWSVPVALVAVAAPAYAASFHPPGSSANNGCKCPGGGSPYTYNINVVFTTPGTDSYTFHVDSFKVDGAALVAPSVFLGPNDVTLPGGEGSALFRFRSTNSSSTHTIEITYTPQNTTTGQTGAQVTLTLTDVMFNPCKTGDVFSCA